MKIARFRRLRNVARRFVQLIANRVTIAGNDESIIAGVATTPDRH
jgi:hypothetical protein